MWSYNAVFDRHAESEGNQVLNELKRRGVADILLCRRPQSLPRGERGDLLADGRADLHRNSDALAETSLRAARELEQSAHRAGSRSRSAPAWRIEAGP